MIVPDDATDLSFVVTDGDGVWDNNSGNNYVSQVKASRAVSADLTKRVEPREVESVEAMPHAAGGREGGRTGGSRHVSGAVGGWAVGGCQGCYRRASSLRLVSLGMNSAFIVFSDGSRRVRDGVT